MGSRKKRANGEGTVFFRADRQSWVGQIVCGLKPNGRPNRLTFYAPTQSEVLAWRRDKLRAIEDGRPVRVERQSVDQFIRFWLWSYVKPNSADATMATYESLARVHVVPALGSLQLGKLTRQHVQEFLAAKATEHGVGAVTVKRIRDLLRAAFNVAIDMEKLERNPAEKVKLPRIHAQQGGCYSQEEARRFLAVLDGNRLQALYTVALCLGMRRGEVLGLRWQDIDFESSTIHVRQAVQRVPIPSRDQETRKRGEKTRLQIVPTKTPKSRRDVAVPAIVIGALAEHKRRQDQEKEAVGESWIESGLVFTSNRGTVIDPGNLLREYKKLIDLHALPKLRFHDLRHSAATILLELGVPLHVVQQVLGHTSSRTTLDTYTHVLDSAKRGAAKAMDDALGKPVAVTVAVKQRKSALN